MAFRQGNITSSDLTGSLKKDISDLVGKCRVEKLMLMFIPKPIPMGKSEDNKISVAINDHPKQYPWVMILQREQ